MKCINSNLSTNKNRRDKYGTKRDEMCEIWIVWILKWNMNCIKSQSLYEVKSEILLVGWESEGREILLVGCDNLNLSTNRKGRDKYGMKVCVWYRRNKCMNMKYEFVYQSLYEVKRKV